MNSDDFLVSMGKRIVERRKQLGLSQEELAVRAYISTATLSTAERGIKEMRCENLQRISSALQVSADYLLTGDMVDKDISQLAEQLSSIPAEQLKSFRDLLEIFINQDK